VTEKCKRDWRDPAWTGVSSVRGGIAPAVSAQRHTLFGANEINIESKSTTSLLVEEARLSGSSSAHRADTYTQVIHPFYVFQIASIILWSLDDYYYYAFCIALISAISIATTLMDTKRVRVGCIRVT
jgi:cation-transporting ATPase 13A2